MRNEAFKLPLPLERAGGEALLSTTYFGPVQWYQKLCRHERIVLEACESFTKQTYRNRCIIATTNGLQALTVPVEHCLSRYEVRGTSYENTSNPEPRIKDIRISNHGSWRHQHWNALQSAYSESPFFEYYADDLRPFFERDYEFLYDLNLDIMQKMCELLDIHPAVEESQEWTEAPQSSPFGDAPHDFRTAISPKHPTPDTDFTPRPYWQVFQHKHGFLPNLSILDLLFCKGPEAIFWLL
ncbi:MAG: WbqC family protein [Prevotella sp.]|nr:WbqC family protein [Prevotella sp.]